MKEGVNLTIAANLIEACALDPDELERMIRNIATGSQTNAEGISMLLPKLRISPEITTKSSELFIATCRKGLEICSKLDRRRNEVCINPKQCAFLTERVHQVTEYLREWQNLEHPHIWVCSSAMIDLIRCLESGLSIVESCGKSNWKRRALLGDISAELICIHKDLDSLLECIISILGTPNKRNSFELASSEALHYNASEDLKHLKEQVLQAFKKEPRDRLLGYLKSKYGRGGNQPAVINSHDIIRKQFLGVGSFGSVQKVQWMDQILALKSFPTEIYMDEERDVLSQVSHPNIVKVIGYPDRAILMELLQTDLKRAECLSIVVALDIMYQVAKAMSYLHDIDIVHRDLKPANILLNSSLQSSWSPQFFAAKVADFGISKASFDTWRTNTGMRGTLSYMAPELLTGDYGGHYNRKVDIYSFGVTFTTILGATDLEELDTCPSYLKPLLHSCLNINSELRPSFKEICNVLSFLRHQLILCTDGIESEFHQMQYYDESQSIIGEIGEIENTPYHNEQSEFVENTYHTIMKTFGPEGSMIVLEKLTAKLRNDGKDDEIDDKNHVNGPSTSQSDDTYSCILHGTKDLPFKLRSFCSIQEITLHVKTIDLHLQNMLSFIHVCNNQCKFLMKSIAFVVKCMDVWSHTGMNIQASSYLLEELMILIYKVYIFFMECQRRWVLKAAFGQENRATVSAIHKDIRKYVHLINSLVPDSHVDEKKNLKSLWQQREIKMQELVSAAELDREDSLQTLRNTSLGGEPDSRLAAFLYNMVQNPADSFIPYDELKPLCYIGQGGNGAVFRTEWLQQQFAVKIFKGVTDKVFMKELSALAFARHPNIVRFFGRSKSDDTGSCLIMELMDMNLSSQIGKRWLSQKVQLDIMLQVAKAMKFLHKQNVIHRDLKPDNILLSLDCLHAKCKEEEHVNELILAKVADFGLAKTKFESAKASNTIGKGTYHYMSPEMYRDRYTRKTDVYSYGMTCYHLLTGEKPFAGDLDTPFAVDAFFVKLRKGKRPPLHSVPEIFHPMLESCWHRDPSKRPSFKDIGKTLKNLRNQIISKDSECIGGAPKSIFRSRCCI